MTMPLPTTLLASIASPSRALAGLRATAALAAMLGLSGCGQPGGGVPKPMASRGPEAGHDHAAGGEHAADHDHGHDHGDGGHAAGGHDHGPGPHGGTLADWGGGTYHVEFTVDHGAKEAVVYVLGGDERTPARVELADGKLLLTIREPAFQVELAAQPLEGETEGRASRYAGRHESLGIVREFAGTISGAVDGTPFAGDFSEQAHDHE
jgi:hypothetical protein